MGQGPKVTAPMSSSPSQARYRRPPRPGLVPRYSAGRHWSPEARRALVASLRSGPPGSAGSALAEAVGRCDPGELVDLAVSEGIAGPALEGLGHLLPPPERCRLAAAARQEALRHLTNLGLLQRCATALEAAGLTWAVLKGPVLAELCYGRAVRGYTDLDLMVAPSQLEHAVRALETVGASLAEPDWTSLVADAMGQLSMVVNGAGVVDLHWHLVYLRSARESWRIPTDELLERRRPLRLGPVNAWALGQVDFAAHIALHASFAGAQQLRRMLDIDRTLAAQPPDWDALVERCRAWRVGLPVGVMLNRTRAILGAPVPEEALRRLAGGRLEGLIIRQLSAWVPSGHLPGGRSVNNGLIRSLRDGFFPTTTQFTAESWHAISNLVHPARARLPGAGDVAPDHEGREAFTRYVQMVASADRYGHGAK
ncbi:MAG: nucleotidyltransferase family protein [Acidimicrobiales bacterium]